MTKLVGAIKRFFCKIGNFYKRILVLFKLKIVFAIQSFKEKLNVFKRRK